MGYEHRIVVTGPESGIDMPSSIPVEAAVFTFAQILLKKYKSISPTPKLEVNSNQSKRRKT